MIPINQYRSLELIWLIRSGLRGLVEFTPAKSHYYAVIATKDSTWRISWWKWGVNPHPQEVVKEEEKRGKLHQGTPSPQEEVKEQEEEEEIALML